MKTFSPNNPFLKMLLVLSFFVFAASFLPVVGMVFFIFIPALIFSYSAVAGKLKTTAAFLIPVGLTFFFSYYYLHSFAPYPMFLIMGIVGICISVLASKNNSIEKTVAYPALIIFGIILTFIIYLGWQHSVNPLQLVQQYVAKIIEQNINLYSKLPLDSKDIDLIKNNKSTFISILTNFFPVLIIIGSVLIVWINVLMGRNLLRGKSIFFPKLEGLAGWHAPEFIIWIFICSGGLLFMPHEQTRFFSQNVFILTCFIYFLQGLAIVSFIFQTKNVPVFLRYLFYFLIGVQQFLMLPVLFAGLFDIWVDFRRFFQKNETVA